MILLGKIHILLRTEHAVYLPHGTISFKTGDMLCQHMRQRFPAIFEFSFVFSTEVIRHTKCFLGYYGGKHFIYVTRKHSSISIGSSRGVGGPRNMKSMWLPLVAIFFMTYLYRAGGGPLGTPLDPLLSMSRGRDQGRCHQVGVHVQ